MRRMLSIAVALWCYGATARAQDTAVSGRCATPDTIVFRGAERTGDATVRSESGLVPGPVNYRALERAIKAVYATGQFDDVIASCELGDGRAALTFTLKERPVLGSFDVTGTDRLSRGSVRDKIELTPGKPLDPAQVAHAVKRVDSLYQAGGYYLARVKPETTVVNGQVNLLFRIEEGRRLAVSGVRIEGNAALRDKTVVKARRHFSGEDLARFYPFGDQGTTLGGAVKSVLRAGRGGNDRDYFDQAAWEDATRRVGEAYANEGYIYANVRPVVERVKVGADSAPTVNLRWEVDEKTPAIVNRVEILGNDITNESCIRNQIFVVPGDVFRRDALLRSYQGIGNLGFFETPLPAPDTKPANDQGDVDIVFHVKEKRTGNVNFGASVGQGAGVGGFIGFDQPNLFGMCKKGSLNWQFGQYINDFSLTYSDPFIRESQISGTVTAYHSITRYYVPDV